MSNENSPDLKTRYDAINEALKGLSVHDCLGLLMAVIGSIFTTYKPNPVEREEGEQFRTEYCKGCVLELKLFGCTPTSKTCNTRRSIIRYDMVGNGGRVRTEYCDGCTYEDGTCPCFPDCVWCKNMRDMRRIIKPNTTKEGG